MSATLVVDVMPVGQIQLDAQGFKGTACVETASRLQAHLQTRGLDLDLENQVGKPDLALEPEVQRQRSTQQ